MQAGFSFDGVDISKLGLEYVPELEDVYVYKPGQTEVHEETFDGHNGGYFYGAYRKPKEFILRCMFEEKQIDQGILANIFSLFRVGKTGKLVFARRPWCYYYATVTEVPDISELFNYMNGIFKVSMKAYYPYARCDSFVNVRAKKGINDSDAGSDSELERERINHIHDQIESNTALFDREEMIPTFKYTFKHTNISQQKTIYLPNPGTEPAAVGIKIDGEIGGSIVHINNTTNKTSCSFTGITKDNTTNINQYVYADAISGKVIIGNDVSRKHGFIYHNEGYLYLDPCFPAMRSVMVKYDGSRDGNYDLIHIVNNIPANLVGKHVFVQGKWRQILEMTEQNTFKVDAGDSHIENTGVERTMIVQMNEIVIVPEVIGSSSDIDVNIEFVYKPTFA